jgi:hypothetical protein
MCLAIDSSMSRRILPVLLKDRSVLSVVPTVLAKSVCPMPLALRYSSIFLAAIGLSIVALSRLPLPSVATFRLLRSDCFSACPSISRAYRLAISDLSLPTSLATCVHVGSL